MEMSNFEILYKKGKQYNGISFNFAKITVFDFSLNECCVSCKSVKKKLWADNFSQQLSPLTSGISVDMQENSHFGIS